MSLQKLKEEIKKEYWDKVKELQNENHWGSSRYSPIYEFGSKTQRPLDKYKHGSDAAELFTLTDWGNIEKFLMKKINITTSHILSEVNEVLEGMKKKSVMIPATFSSMHCSVCKKQEDCKCDTYDLALTDAQSKISKLS